MDADQSRQQRPGHAADVPTVGTTTIEKLAAAGAACVVLEAGKTIMLEKQKVLELADRYKIAIVGYEGHP